MADLIDLFPGKKGEQSDHEAPVRNQERDHQAEPRCKHHRVGLHHESRRVYCEDCSREVPAFDTLQMLAHEWERYKLHRDHARTDAKRAQKRLDDLKRQEANAKSRLRTTRDKLATADPAWARLEELVRRRHYLTAEELREAMYTAPAPREETDDGE